MGFLKETEHLRTRRVRDEFAESRKPTQIAASFVYKLLNEPTE